MVSSNTKQHVKKNVLIVAQLCLVTNMTICSECYNTSLCSAPGCSSPGYTSNHSSSYQIISYNSSSYYDDSGSCNVSKDCGVFQLQFAYTGRDICQENSVKHYCNTISLKSDPNHYIALFGSDDIPLRVISDWPFSEPMESLLPNFGPVARGAKRKMMFDVTDVTLCKHSETFAPFSCLYHLEMIRNCKKLKGTSAWNIGNRR